MNTPTLWVWMGSPDDTLDVLRYARATERDILSHPAVQAALAARDERIRVLVEEIAAVEGKIAELEKEAYDPSECSGFMSAVLAEVERAVAHPEETPPCLTSTSPDQDPAGGRRPERPHRPRPADLAALAAAVAEAERKAE